MSYSDVAGAMGLPEREEQPHNDGGFVAVDDLDANGLPDVLFQDVSGPGQIAWNLGDHFDVQTSDGWGEIWQSNIADLDGDGWRDLTYTGLYMGFIPGGDAGNPVRIPLEPPPGVNVKDIRELSPGDVDGDGDYDLYPLLRGHQDGELMPSHWLLLNDGFGNFTAVDDMLPASFVAGQGIDSVWFDQGADRDIDLYVVNDQAPIYGANVLATQEDGEFVDGTDACSCGLALSGMGVSVGDGNGDGLPDLFVANSFSTVLLEGMPDGSFVNTTAARDAQPITHAWGMAWGSVWLDYDNDGRQDLLVAQGDLWTEFAEERAHEAPIQLLRNTGERYEDVSAELGLVSTGSHRAAVVTDFNLDGVSDFLVTSISGAHHLYLSDGCTAAGWLDVEGPIGAEVRVEAGGRTQVGWISSESGWGASRAPVVHFGLGEAQRVDRLEVRWSGLGVAVDDLEARRTVVVTAK